MKVLKIYFRVVKFKAQLSLFYLVKLAGITFNTVKTRKKKIEIVLKF